MNNETTELVKRLQGFRKLGIENQEDPRFTFNLEDMNKIIKALEDMSKQVAEYDNTLERLGKQIYMFLPNETRPREVEADWGEEVEERIQFARSERKRIAAMGKNDG